MRRVVDTTRSRSACIVSKRHDLRGFCCSSIGPMGRTCPFCANPARSNEHVIPLWISRRYLSNASRRAFFTLQDNDAAHQRQSRTINHKVKVCEDCNNGWMSVLENRAIPLLQGLADGTQTSVTGSEQELLAKWLFKMAVMHELLVPASGRTSTAKQRAGLRLGVVPIGWSAHIAKAEPEPTEAVTHRLGPVVNWTREDGSHRGRARLTTMRFGQMATQVVLHSLDVVPTFAELLGGDEFAAQIWPVEGPVTWPPGGTLTLAWFNIVCDLRDAPGKS